MLKIGKPRKNQRLDLVPGAWIEYREPSTVDTEAALHSAREFFESVRKGSAALDDLGFDVGDVGLLGQDAALAAGVGVVAYYTELGMRCFSKWDGVANEDGAAMELSRGNLATLLSDPTCFDAVKFALSRRSMLLESEGNASAPSQSGEPGAAEPIAPVAAN